MTEDLKKNKKDRKRKESDERYTPEYVLDVVRSCGPIVLDPCTTIDNRTKASYFYTFEDNGLDQDWFGTSKGGLIFVNPPFSNLRKWAAKCSEEHEKGCNIIALLPGDTSTIWFQDYVGKTASSLCFWRGRIEFIRTTDAFKAGAMQPTMFACWGKDIASEFALKFGLKGFIVSRFENSLILP